MDCGGDAEVSGLLTSGVGGGVGRGGVGLGAGVGVGRAGSAVGVGVAGSGTVVGLVAGPAGVAVGMIAELHAATIRATIATRTPRTYLRRTFT